MLYEAPGVVLTGRIEGKITDRKGRPLAGAKVEASNTPLKVSRATTTDANGMFRMALLPPGEYTLRTTKAGYPPSASIARVNAGQATTLGIQMIPDAGSAVVEVIAAGGGVDRSETKAASNYSAEFVQALEPTPDHYEDSGDLSRAWILEGKRDLPSDALSRRILLARAHVEPRLRLKALPRSSTEVFLIAPLPAPSGFPWFPGTRTAVFRNGEQMIEVQEPNIHSGSDQVKVVVLPEATPASETGDNLTWVVKVPSHGQAKIVEAWRITSPTMGSIPEIALLGLPNSD